MACSRLPRTLKRMGRRATKTIITSTRPFIADNEQYLDARIYTLTSVYNAHAYPIKNNRPFDLKQHLCYLDASLLVLFSTTDAYLLSRSAPLTNVSAMRAISPEHVGKRQFDHNGYPDSSVQYLHIHDVDGFFFGKQALSNTAKLSQQLADISKSKVIPRSLSPYREMKSTETTTEIDLP